MKAPGGGESTVKEGKKTRLTERKLHTKKKSLIRGGKKTRMDSAVLEKKMVWGLFSKFGSQETNAG